MTVNSPSTSRRRLLGALALLPVTLPNAASAASNPIFEVIAAHQKAVAAVMAKNAIRDAALEAADEHAGAPIMVPNLAGVGEPVEVSCWTDIAKAIPSDQYPELFADYAQRLKRRQAARNAFYWRELTGREDGDDAEFSEKEDRAELAAIRTFQATIPTTVQGLFAMLIYAADVSDNDPGVFGEDDVLLGTLADAAKALRANPLT